MSRKIPGYTLLVLLCYLLQFVWVPLRHNAVAPDFLLLAAVAAAVRDSEKAAALTGLACGLLTDYSGGGLFGFRGILYMLMGFFLSRLIESAFSAGLPMMFGSFLASFVLTRLLGWVGRFVVYGSFSLPDMLLYVTLPEFLMTLLCCPFVFWAACLASPGRIGENPSRRRRENRL